jgi:RHS repeat-associated protein
MQGAGGVGGLLEVSDYGSSTTTNCFAAFDGNGNLAALVNAANGTTLANYEYGPFGEVIRATGPMAKMNPFRFSTIYQDDESDLLMYVHRPYKASTGTWVSRDPLGDEAFMHGQLKNNSWANQHYLREQAKLPGYMFAENNPVAGIDLLGLKTLSVGLCEIVIFYGHGETTPYVFDSAGPCCAGVFIGCWDAATDNGIPPLNQIPGAPTTDDTMEATDLDKYFNEGWTAAEAKAQNMLKLCHCVCPSVTIKAVKVNTGDPLLDSWVPDESRPNQTVTSN